MAKFSGSLHPTAESVRAHQLSQAMDCTSTLRTTWSHSDTSLSFRPTRTEVLSSPGSIPSSPIQRQVLLVILPKGTTTADLETQTTCLSGLTDRASIRELLETAPQRLGFNFLLDSRPLVARLQASLFARLFGSLFHHPSLRTRVTTCTSRFLETSSALGTVLPGVVLVSLTASLRTESALPHVVSRPRSLRLHRLP